VEEVNADPNIDVSFRVTERDPDGRLDRYAPLCREILRGSQARHIFGCITSASRKEVIPELERFDGVLWYPVPYEGFEASERVAYMHSCPNQHLLPLLDWALPTLGTRAYLVGSNYIWGWEMAQIAREKIAAAGGQVLGDRYLPIGDTELDHIINDIRALKPDFILNSLVGDSSYAFLARLAQLKHEAEFADGLTVLSCNFTECEIDAAGYAAEGLVSAGPWFEPDGGIGGSFHEMARQAVHELALLLQGRPGAEELPLAELLHTAIRSGRPTRLDPVHLHARQPTIIARLESGRFREIRRLHAMRADPYLTHRSQPAQTGSRLKVVS
jgi:ABC-type branched-subunit amino acid transport system substrate-binding protein